jgi:hypothetical protein
MERAFTSQLDLETAVLAWAVEYAPAAEAVDRVNMRRIGILSELFRRLGHDEIVSRSRATLLCSMYLGRMHLRHGEPDSAAREQIVKAFIALGS